MTCSKNLPVRALAVISILLFVSGCFESGKPTTKPVPIPPLTTYAAADCPDPGVAADAIQALAEHRVALADCRKRKRVAVSQYEAIRTNFGTQ